jgi:hypothetical protein
MRRGHDLPGFRVLAAVPGHYQLCTLQNLTLVFWAAQANGSAAHNIMALTRDFVLQHPTGFSNIHIVREGAPLPDAAARACFVKMMDEFQQDMKCVGVVLDGAGFWASAVQGAITGMRMLAPRTFAIRVASTADEIASWLAPESSQRTGVVLEPARVREAIHAARSF